jgi:hypothetical protein
MTDWGAREIGAENRLSKQELMNLLGWTPLSKAKAITKVVVAKIL